MNYTIGVIMNILKYCLICYILMIGSYAFEYYYIEYLASYWDVMPDDIFIEEIISILNEYDNNISKYNHDEFIKISCFLYKTNIDLRIKLFKYGLKQRFIEYFNIDK